MKQQPGSLRKYRFIIASVVQSSSLATLHDWHHAPDNSVTLSAAVAVVFSSQLTGVIVQCMVSLEPRTGITKSAWNKQFEIQ